MILKNNKVGLVFLTGLMLVIFISCNWSKKYEKEEQEKIQQYLADHPDDTFELKPSGLYYLDVVVGTGKLTETKDTSYVLFKAYDLNGKLLQSNYGKDTLVFPVNEGYYIPGFEEALSYMRGGGKSKALVPSSLAYQDYNPWLYEIYLIKVVAGPGTAKK
jgi:FKBP-type peptidyl-prolyl cis-trans isomerase